MGSSISKSDDAGEIEQASYSEINDIDRDARFAHRYGVKFLRNPGTASQEDIQFWHGIVGINDNEEVVSKLNAWNKDWRVILRTDLAVEKIFG